MNLLISSKEYDYHTLVKVAEMAGLAGVIGFHQAGDDYLVTFPDGDKTEALIADYKGRLKDLENNIWSPLTCITTKPCPTLQRGTAFAVQGKIRPGRLPGGCGSLQELQRGHLAGGRLPLPHGAQVAGHHAGLDRVMVARPARRQSGRGRRCRPARRACAARPTRRRGWPPGWWRSPPPSGTYNSGG